MTITDNLAEMRELNRQTGDDFFSQGVWEAYNYRLEADVDVFRYFIISYRNPTAPPGRTYRLCRFHTTGAVTRLDDFDYLDEAEWEIEKYSYAIIGEM